MIGKSGSMISSAGALASHASRIGKMRPKAVLVVLPLMAFLPFVGAISACRVAWLKRREWRPERCCGSPAAWALGRGKLGGPNRGRENRGAAAPLRIRNVDHLVLRVTDLDAMLRFYIDILGCSMEKVQEKLGLYQLRAGSALIDLVPVSGQLGQRGGAAPGREGRNMDHFCLRIDPYD